MLRTRQGLQYNVGMAELRITRTTPVYRNSSDHGVFVQWDLAVPPVANVQEFKVERSGAPEGPFELVMDKILSYHFFDKFRWIPDQVNREHINYLSLSRSVYYKVTMTAEDGTSISDIRAVMPEIRMRKIALLRRKMQRDLSVAFKFNTVDIAVLKRRHWGVRCTACFDLLTKQTTESKCLTCYGTGFEGGYFDPIRIRGRLGVQNVQSNVTPQGKADVNKKRLTILTYPEVEHDDIVVDIAQNKRYIVQNRHQTELQTRGVHQVITVSELARDAIQYRIPSNFDHIPVIY